jgi:hypothetical protein
MVRERVDHCLAGPPSLPGTYTFFFFRCCFSLVHGGSMTIYFFLGWMADTPA